MNEPGRWRAEERHRVRLIAWCAVTLERPFLAEIRRMDLPRGEEARRRGRTRADAVDPDVTPARLIGEAPGVVHDRGLDGRVRDLRRRPEMTGALGDVDRAPAAAVHPPVHDPLTHQHRPDEITVQERADIFEFHVKRVVRVGFSAFRTDVSARGIDENRYRTELRFDLLRD